MAVHPVLPSARLHDVGIPEYLPLAQQGMYFTAQYPTCTSPANASATPSRATPHDSGPLRFARSSTYETFIHNTLPVLTGARSRTC
jgi:hypothetical protein